MNPDGPVPEPEGLVTRTQVLANIIRGASGVCGGYLAPMDLAQLAVDALDALERDGGLMPWGVNEDGEWMYDFEPSHFRYRMV